MHFYRSGNVPAILFCLFLLAAFLIRRPWAARILQLCLALGAVEWGRTTIILMQARIEAGAPFLRLAFILGCLTLLTASSLFVFRTMAVRRYFNMITEKPNEVTIRDEWRKSSVD